jgi:hypothetical protein
MQIYGYGVKLGGERIVKSKGGHPVIYTLRSGGEGIQVEEPRTRFETKV